VSNVHEWKGVFVLAMGVLLAALAARLHDTALMTMATYIIGAATGMTLPGQASRNPQMRTRVSDRTLIVDVKPGEKDVPKVGQ
jgi:hypothetical protein